MCYRQDQTTNNIVNAVKSGDTKFFDNFDLKQLNTAYYGNSLLNIAVAHTDVAMIQHLLELGADPNMGHGTKGLSNYVKATCDLNLSDELHQIILPYCDQVVFCPDQDSQLPLSGLDDLG